MPGPAYACRFVALLASVVLASTSAQAQITWHQTCALPMGLTDHQLVYLGGYVYCIGGRSDSSPEATDGVYYAPVNGDGGIGAWQETASLPQPTAAAGAAAYMGRVYLWGGWTTGYQTLNTCHYAEQGQDGSLSAWTLSGVTIPDNTDVSPPGTQMHAFGRGTMMFNGALYIINGGWSGGGSYGITNSCYYGMIAADRDFGPWVETTPTDTANGAWFHGVAAIEGAAQGYMYRVGGSYGGTTEWSVYSSVVQPGGSLGEWVEDEVHLPEARYEVACAVADNRWLFLICGLYGTSAEDSVFYAAIDSETGTLIGWREGPSYPETVARNAAVTYEMNGRTYILVVGGGPYSAFPDRTPNCYYAAIAEVICFGDLDGDRAVDLADLAQLLSNYGLTSSTQYEDGDLDGDGDVDLSDLAALLAVYGTTC